MATQAQLVRYLADGTTEVVELGTLGVLGVARQLTAANASANIALTPTCRKVSLVARVGPLRFAVGVGEQTANAATSHYLEQDSRIVIAVPPGANIAAIRLGAAIVDSELEISELV